MSDERWTPGGCGDDSCARTSEIMGGDFLGVHFDVAPADIARHEGEEDVDHEEDLQKSVHPAAQAIDALSRPAWAVQLCIRCAASCVE